MPTKNLNQLTKSRRTQLYPMNNDHAANPVALVRDKFRGATLLDAATIPQKYPLSEVEEEDCNDLRAEICILLS